MGILWRRKMKSNRKKLRLGIIYILLIIFSIIFALPFYWLVSTSLKTDPQIFVFPPIWIPNPIDWGNYPEALTYIPFMLYLRNTLIIVVFVVVGSLLSCSLVAYGLSKIKWPGRDLLFFIALSTMMLPYQVIMIPIFIIFKNLGWVNSFKPLTVPAFFGNAFFIFLLRQFFMSIPMELSDAARIDGCSEFRIYSRIVLPLAKPVLATVGLFSFMGSWNDFLGPLIYISDPNKYTISLGLAMYRSQYGSQWAMLMAASTVVILPIIIIFFFTQRTFIQGIALTGLKG
jgi:ABC-type glycerol-3-phosphate transport system permease component